MLRCGCRGQIFGGGWRVVRLICVALLPILVALMLTVRTVAPSATPPAPPSASLAVARRAAMPGGVFACLLGGIAF